MNARVSLLTLIEITLESSNKAYRRAKYKCECGNIKELNMRKVIELKTLSCGCLKRKNCHFKTHGKSVHPLYKVWKGIRKRCYNKKDKAYPRYGGIGITMCDEWANNPDIFIEWGLANGWKAGLDIDKDIIPKKIGAVSFIYSPQTCLFVSRKQNCNARRSNKEYTFRGKTLNIKQWSEVVGISPSLIRHRLVILNWSIEDALTKAPNKKCTGRPPKK